ncbi:MAG: CPBP family intramembrane metalloprotease [Clostridiales bacterium]|nr:CPBP family intramembrane metalloprotease [Clostridiales bacterium]
MKNDFGIRNDLPPLAAARAKKPGLRVGLEILIFFALFSVASAVESLPTALSTGIWVANDKSFIDGIRPLIGNGDFTGIMNFVEAFMKGMPVWLTLVTLFATVLATAVCILFCRVIQKRGLSSMGFVRRHAVREYLLGALVGVVMISATALLGLAFGAYRFTPAKPNWGIVLLFLLGYFFQGMSEEVLCRSCFLVSLSRRNNVWLAIAVSSSMFALLHVFNPGFGVIPFVNILLSGAFFATYFLKRGSIWGACAIHSFWNFFQGNFYGISVSGTGGSDAVSVFSAEALKGSKLLTGGTFGIEGSVWCTVVMAAALLILIFVVKPKKEPGEA